MIGLKNFRLFRSLGFSVCVVLLFLRIAPFSVRSQEVSSNLSGTVVDPTGAAVPGAQVALIGSVGERVSAATTDEAGRFTFSDIKPGIYSVKITVQGFATRTINNVSVQTGQAANLNVVLAIGVISQPVEVTSGSEAPPPSESHFEEPFWNVWQEEGSQPRPSYRSVKMVPDHRYLVVVNLAALAYEKFLKGSYSSQVSKEFDDWLRNNSQDQASLTVLALPDERYFEAMTGAERVRTLTIDLKKLQKVRQKGFKLAGNPFDVLMKKGDKAPFSFGTVSFLVRTKKNIAGSAAIAFSLWDDEKPVTELSYSTCVEPGSGAQNQCSAVPPLKYSLVGVDMHAYHKSPTGALHFVELDANRLVGVFRCNTCNWAPYEFKYWTLMGGADWFKQQFTTTVLPGIRLAANGPPAADNGSTVYNEPTFNNAADTLYRLLFPTGASDAETAFRAFVTDAVDHHSSDAIAPSIFVRLLPQRPEDAFVVPMGLVRVPLSNGRNEFLGFHFRIQTPLEIQDYSEHTTCPSTWVLLMPPANLTNNPLTDARYEFKDWIDVFLSDTSHATLFDDVDKFKGWLVLEQPPGKRPDNYAVMILSHHSNNSLWIDQYQSSIFAPIIGRMFGNPSMAIIDACGTANPGAFEFVQDFNNHGVFTIIASSVEVDAKLGGDFLKSLAEQISAPAHQTDGTYTIDRAMYDAIQDLSKQKDNSDTPVTYGPRALIYGLLGNGNVKICVPGKPSSTTRAETTVSSAPRAELGSN